MTCAVTRQQLPERLGLECADLVVAADDHGQHGRLHPADAPEDAAGTVADGVISRRVQADDPIRLAAAAGRGVECVVIGERPEPAEGVANGRLGQRAEPEPTRRFFRAADQLLDVPEDQLPLAAGIGGADQLVRRAEEAADDRELLARSRLIDRLEPEPLGNERQRRPATTSSGTDRNPPAPSG